MILGSADCSSRLVLSLLHRLFRFALPLATNKRKKAKTRSSIERRWPFVTKLFLEFVTNIQSLRQENSLTLQYDIFVPALYHSLKPKGVKY